MSNAHFARLVLACATAVVLGACGQNYPTMPAPPADQIEFTGAQINSLDSTGQVLEQNNSTDGTVKSLVDSTLLVLTAGVTAKRLNVTTDLTSAPLYSSAYIASTRGRFRPRRGPSSAWTIRRT